MGRSKVWVGQLADNDLVAYTSVLISFIVYGFGVMVYESSNMKKIISNSKGTFFGLNLSRDSSEHEWNNYLEKMLTEKSIVYFLLVPIIDSLSKKYAPKFSREIMICYAIAGFVHYFTIYGLLFASLVTLVFFYASQLKRKSAIWFVSVVVMYSVQDGNVIEAISARMNVRGINTYNDFVIILYFMILRFISFCMDKIDATLAHRLDLNSSSYTLSNLIAYTFYPTGLTFSPFISFKNFKPSLDTDKRVTSLRDLKSTACYAFRILISALLVEATLRLTFTYSLVLYHQQFFSYFTKPSLIMAHLLRGTLFTAKYIVYYGFPTMINELVGMRVSQLPRCITLMNTNGELWKYFDTGMYDFIKNYLYIPLGGNKNYHLASLILSFSFVSYWHGFGFAVSLWSLINCSMIIAETVYANYFLKQEFVQQALSSFTIRKKRFLLSLLLAIWQLVMYLNASLFLDPFDSTVSFYQQFFLNKSIIIYFPITYACFVCSTQLRLEFVDFLF